MNKPSKYAIKLIEAYEMAAADHADFDPQPRKPGNQADFDRALMNAKEKLKDYIAQLEADLHARFI